MASESTPLVPPSAGGGSTSSYYFLRQNSDAQSYEGGGGESVTRDADGGEVLETLPDGASSQEFAPRSVMTPSPKPQNRKTAASVASANNGSQNKNDNGGFFKKIFSAGSKTNAFEPKGQGFGTLVKERKAPIKVEPKVFFANERTFLAWLHTAIMLAGASIAIVAFADANPWSQLYGVILLPVSIAFIVYAMVQYTRRANMIRRKEPGPFEDTVGPTVLGILLMLSIVAQFSIKLYSMM
mmetsp:Transcript_9626/g.11517  ORF Transcript_9626/g.11517 Transcript_9626/m.11517 type:complete len:240 (+) Transcript_9626:125-844(+)